MRAQKRSASHQRAERSGALQRRNGASGTTLRLAKGGLLGAPDLLALQRAIGNRATGQLLHPADSRGAPSSGDAFTGRIQRMMSMSSLQKAFEALGADAAVSSMPNFEYGAALNRRIAAAQTAQERQRVIAEVQQAYGIDSDGEGMTYDTDIEDDEAVTSSGRPAQIGPALFALSTGPLAHLRMALTLNHENLHRQQYKRIGETDIAYAPNVGNAQADQIRTASIKEQMLREVMAYESELVVIEQFRNTFYKDEEPPEPVEQELRKFEQHAEEERDDHLSKLSGTEQALFQQGKYAELLASIRQQVPDEAVRFAASEQYWSDFISATAMLYKLKSVAARLVERKRNNQSPSRPLLQTWKMIDSALERRFYESSIDHWWLVRTPVDVSTLDIKAEVERMLKEDALVPPFDLWGRVRESGWIPRGATIP
ncbi:MAG TPA: hypothetical protein VFS21_36665 [Roseiflexaceae bacterium]|nr:hypothetical protein [Roseiflexaceae bacterium]